MKARLPTSVRPSVPSKTLKRMAKRSGRASSGRRRTGRRSARSARCPTCRYRSPTAMQGGAACACPHLTSRTSSLITNWIPLDMASSPVSATMPFIEAVSRCRIAWARVACSTGSLAGTGGTPRRARHEQADSHRHAQQTNIPSSGEDDRGRSPRPRMVRIPGDGGQGRADGEVPEPLRVVRVEDRQQLVAAGEGRDDDRQDVVLQQRRQPRSGSASA